MVSDSEKMGVASIDGERLKPRQAAAPDGEAPQAGHNRVAHAKPIDAETGFEVDQGFAPFGQRDDALRNAAWHFTKAFATLKSRDGGRRAASSWWKSGAGEDGP